MVHTSPSRPAGPRYTGKPKVAVLFTSPDTVIEDYDRLLRLADVDQELDRSAATILKINISWQHWYPGCSTAPWQLDGTIRSLKAQGFDRLVAVHNSTVVVDAHEGAIKNKHQAVTDRHGIPAVHLEEPPVRWIRYEPRAKMEVLNEVYPDGIYIPDFLIDKNIIHFPTVKTHVFTQITGAVKNAFGGLLNFQRHWTHSVIHQAIVDLLAIQYEIHPGVFAVMDGTIAGDGPGPRCMVPHVKNVILASRDQIAIDATSAKLMGFDPLSIGFIRNGHERGLGVGDTRAIDYVGDDISNVNWRFHGKQDTLASRGQKLIYHGPLKPLETILLRSPIVPWSYAASNIYHNWYWYRVHGLKRIQQVKQGPWGALFNQY
jgi:uncharacterized protein (DUF362 family)